jgi:hypothetical protein
MVRRIVTLTVLFALACARAPEAPAQQAVAGDEAEADPRDLDPGGTYRDLVAAARELDRLRDTESDAGCLLSTDRLEADLAPGVRPPPDPPEDWEDFLEGSIAPVNVLSRWGPAGSMASASPTFATLTTTLPPLTGPVVVWLLRADDTLVRRSDRSVRGPAHEDDELSASAETEGTLLIAAEADVPLARVRAVLALVPEALRGRVALATALARGTRLPTAPEAPEEDGGDLCRDGLPAPEGPEGELRPEAIVGALGPLRMGAEQCVASTDGPGVAGGLMQLSVAIGPDGAVAEACVREDGTSDPVLRACVLRALRATLFPAPDPPGTVRFDLPLRLAPDPRMGQRPLCAP